MEQYPPTINNEPSNPKPNRLHALAFLKIGIFEFGFAAVVLFLLFGTLNYFNILPISSVFPNQLGWLPRMSSQETPSTVPIQAIPTQATIPTNKTAKEILSKFISNNLTPSVSSSLPAISSKEDDKEQNTFSANWEGKIGTISATFALSPETKDIFYLYLSSIYNAESHTSLSPQTAKDIASVFFTAIQKGEWGCRLFSGGSYCENFWQESDNVKVGVGIMELNENKKLKAIFMCQYSKDSNNYSLKSCSGEFADTGI